MNSLTVTQTSANSYTKNRIDVIDDHFEMFLRCSNMSDIEVEELLKAAERKEICAVGVYIEDSGFRIAEVEFVVDWEKHNDMVKLKGEVFDTDLAGWKDGVAPEAYVSAQHLVNSAKRINLPIRSWIRVSQCVRNDVEMHKQVCERLGYCYGRSASPWKDNPKENARQINGLEEAKVIYRVCGNS